MRTSVVMTSYNGERYIAEQLASILEQTTTADELVLYDDCSTDHTVEVVKSFIDKHALNGLWSLHVNECNLGFASNFFQAMSKATGDIIFFADQDDVWEREKIEEMLQVFDSSNSVQALLCRENRIDQKGRPTGVWRYGTGSLRVVPFDEEVRTCLGAGHLLALRKEFMLRFLDSLYSSGLTFDVPYCMLAAREGGFAVLDKFLVQRRVHSKNTSGIGMSRLDRVRNLSHYLEGRRTRLSYVKYILDQWDSANLSNEDRIELMKAVSIMSSSIDALANKKVVPLFRDLISYNHFLNKEVSIGNIVAYFVGK